jgi:hypothetical protein
MNNYRRTAIRLIFRLRPPASQIQSGLIFDLDACRKIGNNILTGLKPTTSSTRSLRRVTSLTENTHDFNLCTVALTT